MDKANAGRVKFNDITDHNGTSLQSYAETLTEKAKEADFTAVIVFASKERKMLHAVSNIAGSPATAVLGVGLAMYGLDEQQRAEVMAALAQAYGRPETKVEIAPVTSSKPN